MSLLLLVLAVAQAAPVVSARTAAPADEEPPSRPRGRPTRPAPREEAPAPPPAEPPAEAPPAEPAPAELSPELDGIASLDAPSESPPAASPGAATADDALRAEVLALRAEIGALRAALLPPTPADPRAEARAALQAELVALDEQSAKLDAAVAAGLDPSAAAPAREALALRRTETASALTRLDGPPPAGVAWTLDAGVATAYAFRGLNVFQASGQSDAHALLAPAVTATLGDSGVSLGWWGAYQISGANAASLVESGLGAETDLFATWTTQPADGVAVSATFTGYLYPFAAAEAAGTAAPIYVEPSAKVTWSTAVDLGLSAAYMHGVQDALATWRYVYLRPTVSRNVALPADFTLGLSAGAGWKGFVGPTTPDGNVWDATVDVSLTKAFEGGFYLTPSAHAVWTDLPTESFAGESFAWFGLNAGVAI